MAMFEVTGPSPEFNVETSGCFTSLGQSVRYASRVLGITVAFITYACALFGTPQVEKGGNTMDPVSGESWETKPRVGSHK